MPATAAGIRRWDLTNLPSIRGLGARGHRRTGRGAAGGGERRMGLVQVPAEGAVDEPAAARSERAEEDREQARRQRRDNALEAEGERERARMAVVEGGIRRQRLLAILLA